MSVLISDVRYYGSASMPEADSATTGGAIDFSKRVEFDGTAISPSTLFDVVSSSASDTATKIIYSCLDSTGATLTETLTLNGQTKVPGTKSAERLISGLTSGAASAFGLTTPGGTQAAGDVALIAHTLAVSGHTMQTGAAQATLTAPAVAKLQAGDGGSVSSGMVLRTLTGTGANQIRRILAINPNALGADFVAIDRNWAVLPDATTTYEVGHGFHFELGASNAGVLLSTATQVLGITRMFVGGAASDAFGGSARSYYEKVFVNNNNQANALLGAASQVLSDSPALPTGIALDLGLTAGFNDTATIANRQTAPAGISFVVQPSPIAAPGSGNLAASAGSGNAAGALGLWFRLNLAAGAAAYEGAADVRTTGQST